METNISLTGGPNTMKPKVVRNHDGFDIVVDKDSWVCHTVYEDGKCYIQFRHSNGENPLSIGDISGIDFGILDGPVGVQYTAVATAKK